MNTYLKPFKDLPQYPEIKLSDEEVENFIMNPGRGFFIFDTTCNQIYKPDREEYQAHIIHCKKLGLYEYARCNLVDLTSLTDNEHREFC